MGKFENDFQEKMESRLIEYKEKHQYLTSKSAKKRYLYSDFIDNIFPAVKHGFMQYMYEKGMPLHDYINHVRSSQAYCINLFYYLLTAEPSTLCEILSAKSGKELADIENYEFEYSSEENILGEWKSDSNRPEEYVTAVDLRIDAVAKNGEKIIFLVEVKFTEAEFGNCGGFLSSGNRGDARKACETSGILLVDYAQCYLQSSRLKRRYFDGNFNPASSFRREAFQSKCPFIETHQCLRNHSLSKKLATGSSAFFVVVYHESNVAIQGQWKKYTETFNNPAELVKISGEEIVAASKNEIYKKYYQDRYSVPLAV